MKRAIFVRHAKSSWKFPELSDIKRPLNKRGMRDGPLMARKMRVFAQGDSIIQSGVKDQGPLTGDSDGLSLYWQLALWGCDEASPADALDSDSLHVVL